MESFPNVHFKWHPSTRNPSEMMQRGTFKTRKHKSKLDSIKSLSPHTHTMVHLKGKESNKK